MCNYPETINLVSSRQYKSISNIEKISKDSIMKDIGYDYKLNLQTKARLSSVINIYLSTDELLKNFIDPIKELIKRRKQIILDPINTSTKNIIVRNTFSYYTFENLLPESHSLNMAKQHGCIEYLNMKFTIQDKLFIYIESKVYYRWLFIKHKPKAIQPERIILSLDDAEYLVNTFECLHKV